MRAAPATVPANRAALYSSASDNWRSPKNLMDRVHRLGDVGLDPCGAPRSHVRAALEWRGPEVGEDGLLRRWTGHGLVYVNPPYSQIGAWTLKMAEEAAAGAEIVALLPSRTDPAWMHDHVFPTARVVCLWRGRLRFLPGDGKKATSAPFPSMIVYWGVRDEAFCEAFSTAGLLIRSQDLVRPRAWTIAIPRTMPLASWVAKHPGQVSDLLERWRTELRLGNASTRCPRALTPRRVSVTRYGARYTTQDSIRVGGELLTRVLVAEQLVSERFGFTVEYHQAIDRLHPRTEIVLEEGP